MNKLLAASIATLFAVGTFAADAPAKKEDKAAAPAKAEKKADWLLSNFGLADRPFATCQTRGVGVCLVRSINQAGLPA